MGKRLSLWLLFMIAIAINQSAFALTDGEVAHLEIRETIGSLDIDTSKLLIFKDATGRVSIEEIVERGDNLPWQVLDNGEQANFGFSNDVYWVKLILINRSPVDLVKYLTINYQFWDEISVFRADADSAPIHVVTTGDAYTFDTRLKDSRRFVFPLKYYSEVRTTLYLKLFSRDAGILSLSLWDPESYYREEVNEMHRLGMLYGGILMIVAFSTLLFIRLRDSITFYYVFFLCTIYVFSLSLNGFLSQLLPEYPGFVKWIRPALVYLLCFSSIAFSLSFLKAPVYAKKATSILLILKLLACVGLVSGTVLSFQVYLQLSILLALITVVLIMFAGFEAYRNELSSAIYFLVAWLGFAGSVFVYILSIHDIIPNFQFVELAVQFSSLLIAITLAVGLAHQLESERMGALKALRLAFRSKEDSLKKEREVEIAHAQSKAKSDFLAQMSHEIRTPMNGVLGVTQLLTDTELTAQQKELVEVIESSGKSLLTIINDILDFSKIEAGKLELETINFDLDKLLNEIDSLIGSQVRLKKDVSFVIHKEASVPNLLKGDPTRLKQILLNFSTNALKFTFEGSIKVMVESYTDGMFKFSVSDTGIGLTPDQQKRLFGKYSQAESATSRKFGGTGLGLAICKQLAELMGGEVGVVSQSGVGSTFWFTCKLSLGELQNHERSDADYSVDLGGKKLLVVEDNPVNQLVVSKLLKKLGCEFVVCNDGEEGVNEYVNGPNYDVILMDCEMPVLNGFEASKKIREWESENGVQRIPIVALTANVMKDQVDLCYQAGMDYHVAKPIKFQQLVEALSGCVNK